MKEKHLTLTESDHSYLTTLTTSGQLKARKYKRAMTLLLLHDGHSLSAVSKLLKYSYPSVLKVKQNYLADALLCLDEKPRPGRPPGFDGAERAKITALACSDTPEGHARWSLRLLADRAVELELVETISHTQVGEILKKTN